MKIIGFVCLLEPMQYKNDSIQSKIIPILRLPHFFITYPMRKKTRQFQSWNKFLTEWSRSYFVFVLTDFVTKGKREIFDARVKSRTLILRQSTQTFPNHCTHMNKL